MVVGTLFLSQKLNENVEYFGHISRFGKCFLKTYRIEIGKRPTYFGGIDFPFLKCGRLFMRLFHRHLREIDCSSAVVGRPATGTEYGGKSIHWTRMWCQKVPHSSCCGWRHNYFSQQRQAGRANEQSTSLRCLWFISKILQIIFF